MFDLVIRSGTLVAAGSKLFLPLLKK